MIVPWGERMKNWQRLPLYKDEYCGVVGKIHFSTQVAVKDA
jgi:hypothetical protein